MTNYPHWITHPIGADDPCRLLGITPGESDARRIEEAAIERSAEARRYQLTHPAEATRRLEAIARAADALMRRSPTEGMPRPKRGKRKQRRTVVIVTQENGESLAWELKPRRLRLTGPKPARGTRLVLLGADGSALRLGLTARSAEQLGAVLARSAAVAQANGSHGKARPEDAGRQALQARVG
jgi:hypothetical protein